MRAIIQPPSTRDEWAVFVIRDRADGDSELLCSDGVWRVYAPFADLTGSPYSPTVRVPGNTLVHARRQGRMSVQVLFLPWWEGPTVHAAIKQAAAEQECLPAWLREALA